MSNENRLIKQLLLLSLVFFVSVLIWIFISLQRYGVDKTVQSPQASKSTAVNRDMSATLAKVSNLNDDGDYAGAQNQLIKEIVVDASPELKLILANSYLDEGSVRGQEAVANQKALEILLPLEKKYQSTYLNDLIGYSYEIVNDFDKALAYYNKSLSLDPLSVNTLFSIGHAYWLRGETDKAREMYVLAEKGIATGTDRSVQAKVYAGRATLSSDLAVAEQYFLKAASLADSRAFKAEMYSNLANLKLVKQDNAAAFIFSELALNADPSSELAHLAFAKSAMVERETLQANWEKVRESLFKAIFLAPTKAESQYWQGKFEFIAGAHDQALVTFGNALSLIDGDNSLNDDSRRNLRADINFDIAVTHLLKKNKTEAAKYTKEAFRDNPVKITYILQQNKQFKELLAVIKTK